MNDLKTSEGVAIFVDWCNMQSMVFINGFNDEVLGLNSSINQLD